LLSDSHLFDEHLKKAADCCVSWWLVDCQ